MSVNHPIIGQRFGKLRVLSFHHTAANRVAYFLTQCECGGEKITSISRLRNGSARSCGCLARSQVAALKRTHGMTNSREFTSWKDARARCSRKTRPEYPHYGGRGIRVCDAWNASFEQFYRDMGPCPDGMTLERMNVNGNYEPGNCVWASPAIQARNKRNSKLRQADVDEIRRLYDGGTPRTLIAQQFDISPAYVGSIAQFKVWK